MTEKIALITGANGQNGAYLAKPRAHHSAVTAFG
jgi:GDP-D-mannose dehydratase